MNAPASRLFTVVLTFAVGALAAAFIKPGHVFLIKFFPGLLVFYIGLLCVLLAAARGRQGSLRVKSSGAPGLVLLCGGLSLLCGSLLILQISFIELIVEVAFSSWEG